MSNFLPQQGEVHIPWVIPGYESALKPHLYFITRAGRSRAAGRVIYCVCDYVCLCVRALKRKQLQLSIQNLVDIQCVAVAGHALILGSKGQKSRSCGYRMCCRCVYGSRFLTYCGVQVVQLLLICNQQVLAVTSQSRDTDLPTCLHLAARNGHTHVMRSTLSLSRHFSNCEY